MRRASARVAVWLAFGAGIGAALPLPDPGLVPEPTPAAPHARSAAPAPSPAPPPAAFADPCLGVRAAERRVDELAASVEEARGAFEHRFGQPMPGGAIDPGADEARFGELLEGYPGAVWSTVDCALHPCVGLVLTEVPRPISQHEDLARELVGWPDAWVSPETRIAGGRAVDLVAVGFVDHSTDPLQLRWLRSLTLRAQQRHDTEIRAALQALTAER